MVLRNVVTASVTVPINGRFVLFLFLLFLFPPHLLQFDESPQEGVKPCRDRSVLEYIGGEGGGVAAW